MDTISHALWPIAIFPSKKWKWQAALWGILPDLGTFAPLWWLISHDGIRQIKWIIPFTDRSNIPYLTYFVPDIWMAPYHFLHSIIVFFAIAIIVSIITKRIYLPIIGMGLHIILDIFLHSGRYATQFLFPFSDFSIDATYGWQEPPILIINWLLLIIILILGITINYFKKKKVSSERSAVSARDGSASG